MNQPKKLPLSKKREIDQRLTGVETLLKEIRVLVQQEVKARKHLLKNEPGRG